MNLSINIPTKIYFGKNNLIKVIENNNKEKILIVTTKDKILIKTEIFKNLINLLEDNEIDYEILANVTGNPTKEEVDEGIELCKKANCTSILAIGGGSTIDTAKAISFGVSNENYIDFIENPNLDCNEPLKLIVINSTAGTGSEINCFSVITYDNKKVALYSEKIYPNITIIIPELMCTLPYRNTIFQLLDCMFHAMESYLSINSNAFSNSCAEICLRICLKNLKNIKYSLKEVSFREELAIASLYSGLSDMYGGCLSIHALGHAICAYYPNIIHGEGIAMIALEYYKKIEENADRNLKQKFIELSKIFLDYIEMDNNKMFYEILEKIFDNYLEKKLSFKDYNIKKDEFKKFIYNARKYVGELFNNDPIKLNDELCMKILNDSYL